MNMRKFYLALALANKKSSRFFVQHFTNFQYFMQKVMGFQSFK